MNAGAANGFLEERLTMVDRIKVGLEQLREILSKVWIRVVTGIALGALIHGYLPGVIPIIQALLGNGR
jgi:hypothetical protein